MGDQVDPEKEYMKQLITRAMIDICRFQTQVAELRKELEPLRKIAVDSFQRKAKAGMLVLLLSATAFGQYSDGPVPDAVKQMPRRFHPPIPGCTDCYYTVIDAAFSPMGAMGTYDEGVTGAPATPPSTPPDTPPPPVATPPTPPTPVGPVAGTLTNGWYTITADNWQANVTGPKGANYRWGAGADTCTACWDLHTAKPGEVLYPHHSLNDGNDPVPVTPDGVPLELDIQQTDDVQTVTLTDNSKSPAVVTTLTVPSLTPTPPPAPTVVGTITCTATLSADAKSITMACK